ncbi:MAG: hypothetical protein Q7T86_16970 [Hyphomicrobiaceae bacterium]|nr:hypothetical protein [Hyphomicrobiaceae bacterium]
MIAIDRKQYVKAELAQLQGDEPDALPELLRVRLVGRSEEAANVVVQRVSHILQVVDCTLLNNAAAANVDWREVVPTWFLTAVIPTLTPAEQQQHLSWWRNLSAEEKARYEITQKWTLDGWLYWMEPELRQWFMLSLHYSGKDQIGGLIRVLEWPTPWGSLRWLFRAAGCSQLELVDDER